MRIRRPPGRAGRAWLARRLELARRGADVLDEKRRALLREERRLAGLHDAARAEWEEEARESQVWVDRALVLNGERSLRLAAATAPRANATVAWTNVLGVSCPAELQLATPGAVAPARVGGSALSFAARSASRALEAGARYAAVRAAHVRVERELAATARRLRAIEERWIPAHESELAALELSLDESEREDSARARWTIDRLEHSRATGPQSH